VLPRYRPLWDVACGWHKMMAAAFWQLTEESDGDTIRFDYDSGFEWSALALSANYYLSAVEVSLFDLFSQTSVAEVLDVLSDWSRYLTMVKKKLTANRPAGPSAITSTPPGPPAGSPITGPP
jgi:hypothetical protein